MSIYTIGSQKPSLFTPTRVTLDDIITDIRYLSKC
jgi:hypothetical protein